MGTVAQTVVTVCDTGINVYSGCTLVPKWGREWGRVTREGEGVVKTRGCAGALGSAELAFVAVFLLQYNSYLAID